jgi:high-affinity Fe2+/Pb2+ permease
MVKRQSQQSIWPVSVFGLGFLLLIMGLSGVANIQETRRIHQQILAMEDNYRYIESLVEGIRSHMALVAVLRRDRLLDENDSAAGYSRQLAEVRSRTEVSLEQLRTLRPQQDGKAFERLAAALGAYLDMVAAEFRENRSSRRKLDPAVDRLGAQSMTIFGIAEELAKLNTENFESRRRALNQSVDALQNDIWETILTALFVGAVIAGASIFRISSLEKESAAYQRATEQAEGRLRHLSQQLVSSQE